MPLPNPFEKGLPGYFISPDFRCSGALAKVLFFILSLKIKASNF